MSGVFNLSKLKGLFGHEETQLLETLDLGGIAKYLLNAKNVITMVGAGISTSAGIPDFRSPGTGLYDNLGEYGLSDPMDVFTLSHFKRNPEPFYHVARKLYKPDALPTIGHYFIRLLHEKGVLLRHYTQNVDNLERISGLPEDKIVEAHGSFYTGHCLLCSKKYDFEFLKSNILSNKIPKCTSSNCDGVVKPDIVFFGEGLPNRFHRLVNEDFPKCDLLIIMGTSLTVMPFCGLLLRVDKSVPRLYINLSYGNGSMGTNLTAVFLRFYAAGFKNNFLKWGDATNKGDVFYESTVDAGVMDLCRLLKWDDDLRALNDTRTAVLVQQFKEEAKKHP